MAETVAEKKTRLELLKAQKAEIQRKLENERKRLEKINRKAKTAENNKLRKARDKQLYDYGGLVDVAGLIGTDKGAVLGVLMWASEAFKKEPDKLAGFKKRGDSILAQREAAQKAKASKAPTEDTEDLV